MQSRCSLEVACFDVASALIAARSGADRIEFCDNASVGGTTPSLDDFVLIRREIEQPIFVMIRPRGGSFVYTEEEFAEMKRDIALFKDLADGFVFGILNSEGEIEERDNSALVNLARPRPCTMHRAFDDTRDLSKSLPKVIDCGFRTILTSGGADDASTGVKALQRLVRQSGGKIDIMPGGNLRANNIQEIKRETGAIWFHSSARIADRAMTPNAVEIQSMKLTIS